MSNETTTNENSTNLIPAGPELLGKLLSISKSMGTLPKNGYNSFHKYNYVTESDAMNKFRELCVSNKVFTYPNVSSTTFDGEMTSVNVEFTLVDIETGQTIVLTVPGQGTDKGDKGVYKALTGAYKYFIMKTFMVPAGDDPEADSASDKSSSKKAAPKTSSKKSSFGNKNFTNKSSKPALPSTTENVATENVEETVVTPVSAKTVRFGAKKVSESVPVPKSGFKSGGFKGFSTKAAE